jgi:hypothetical protein
MRIEFLDQRRRREELRYQFARLRIMLLAGENKSANSMKSGGQVFHTLSLPHIHILPGDIDRSYRKSPNPFGKGGGGFLGDPFRGKLRPFFKEQIIELQRSTWVFLQGCG